MTCSRRPVPASAPISWSSRNARKNFRNPTRSLSGARHRKPESFAELLRVARYTCRMMVMRSWSTTTCRAMRKRFSDSPVRPVLLMAIGSQPSRPVVLKGRRAKPCPSTLHRPSKTDSKTTLIARDARRRSMRLFQNRFLHRSRHPKRWSVVLLAITSMMTASSSLTGYGHP